ncbi:hypothetical protein FA13DRAFT_1719668 [Coprinellus micaceus]|uniref:Uncharacterized protein n=1 Tax=Coprinellus micaceus TaxID=71717 RepID=A0A4Y7SAX3_COPMI|nr:hypothetical protein FA13DRAFT_1719668 [Coprinellus micaceus]
MQRTDTPKKRNTKRGRKRSSPGTAKDLDVDQVPDTNTDAPGEVGEGADNLPDAPLGRGLRIRAPPQHFKDFSATSAIPFEIPMFGLEIDSPPDSPTAGSSTAPPKSSHAEQRRGVLDASQWKETSKNGFNLYKTYWTLETHPHDPELFLSNSDFQESRGASPIAPQSTEDATTTNPYHPFPNWSSFKLREWYWSDDGGKSRQSFQRLVNLIGDEDFIPQEIRRTNWKKIDSLLASSEFEDDFSREDGIWERDGSSWKTVSIPVAVPFNSASDNPGAKLFTLEAFCFRLLVPIITSKLQDKSAGEHIHVIPCQLWWARNKATKPIRVYSELYHLDAFIEAYREVQLLPPEKEEDYLPRCIVGLMFASDETHLTSFGDAQLWPAYMLFGNESKDRRGKSSLKLFEEIAYFQKNSFTDWYLAHSGKNTVPDEVMSHLHRETFHAQWAALLDDEFVYAYCHGIVVDCVDKVRRHFYPRILTYAADYPKWMKVVGLRAKGGCPCARCLVSADSIPQMGTPGDCEVRTVQKRADDDKKKQRVKKARDLIYGKKNYAVDSAKVEDLLKPTSLTPATNAFSQRLSALGLDIYDAPASDILHEVEIGVWKSLFVHLLRLLEAVGGGKKEILNSRFQHSAVIPFALLPQCVGYETTWGRDFEDLLQCALPTFEGLLPMATMIAFKTFFSRWHTGMHSPSSGCTPTHSPTSGFLDKAKGVPKIIEKRRQGRAEHKPNSKHVSDEGALPTVDSVPSQARRACKPTGTSSSTGATKSDGRKPQGWSLSMPKFHSLGDVVNYIKRAGTTDSYSTQLSERFPPISEVTIPPHKQERRPTSALGHSNAPSKDQTAPQNSLTQHRTEFNPSEPLAPGCYFIGKSQNQMVNLPHFLRLNSNDLATRDFLAKLKLHLFPRIVAALIRDVSEDVGAYPDDSLERLTAIASSPSNGDMDRIYFHSEAMYRHNIFQIPYVTYDGRQDIDTINLNTSRRDFMCLADNPPASDDPPSGINPPASPPTTPQYLYGRVLGVFHTNVMYHGTGALDLQRRRFDFLWVRWFHTIPDSTADPWASKRLERVTLAPIVERDSWGFLDPSQVLRGVHIIPRFALGPLHDEGSDKIFSKAAQDHLDWSQYYVNRFVDRDMVMRFHDGMAVGHLYSHSCRPSSPQPVQFETPMDVDPPEFDDGDEFGSSDTSTTDSEGESEDDARYIAEPDSEEDPDIYE